MKLEQRAETITAEELGRRIGEKMQQENPDLIGDLRKLINSALPKPWYVRAYESVRNLFYKPKG